MQDTLPQVQVFATEDSIHIKLEYKLQTLYHGMLRLVAGSPKAPPIILQEFSLTLIKFKMQSECKGSCLTWCRFCIQSILNVVEYLLKAPFNAMMWASGKPWKEKQKDVESR